MEPEILTRPDETVLGVTVRINPSEANYREIWEQRFMPRAGEIAARAVDPSYYGVYYGTNEPGRVDFVAGMRVAEGGEATAPPGLTQRAVPGGLYAKFRSSMADLGRTWRDIYGRWLPAAEYAEDELRPAVEHYPPEMAGPDAMIEIYVAVKKK